MGRHIHHECGLKRNIKNGQRIYGFEMQVYKDVCVYEYIMDRETKTNVFINASSVISRILRFSIIACGMSIQRYR